MDDSEGDSDNSSGDNHSSSTFWIVLLTRRQRIILFCLGLADLTAYLTMSVMAPFFPDEANKRGVDNTMSGWIFGSFALVQFLASPIIGKLLPKIGSRFCFLAGHFFSGACTVLFGVLEYIDLTQTLTFTILCFVLRSCSAIGVAAYTTAGFAICANEYPEQFTAVIGIMETFVGLGSMLGPAIGGFLFAAGGFIMPFAVLGGFMLLCNLINAIILPNLRDDGARDLSGASGARNRDSNVSMLKFFTSIPVILISIVVVFNVAIWALLDPILELYLVAEYQMDANAVGLVFLVASGTYAFSAPIWGWIAGKVNNLNWLMIIGFVGSLIAAIFLGPVPGFQNILGSWSNNVWVTLSSLALLGATGSLSLVPSFEIILNYVLDLGVCSNSFGTYAAVSGIFGATCSLGEFVGPIVGGSLYDIGGEQFGFSWCSAVLAGFCALSILILIGLELSKYCNCGSSREMQNFVGDHIVHNDERTPLLNNVIIPRSSRTLVHAHSCGVSVQSARKLSRKSSLADYLETYADYQRQIAPSSV